MSTLVIDMRKHIVGIGRYSLAAFCALAAQVYQLFGHGVRSLSMTLAFVPVLLYAVLAPLTPTNRAICPWRPRAGKLKIWPRRWLGATAATLSVAMFLQGILDISGADSPYMIGFYIAAGLTALLALTSACMYRRAAKK